MNPIDYRPTEPHLWLVKKVPLKTPERGSKMSDTKSRKHSYDEVTHLLIELSMERDNDSQMDKYLGKHMQREILDDRHPRRRSSEPNSNNGNSCGG